MLRPMYTLDELRRRGLSNSAIRWAVRKGRLTPVVRSVYAAGPQPPTSLERAVAVVFATRGIASGRLAGQLLDIDAVTLHGPDVSVQPTASRSRAGTRRRKLPPERVVVVDGVPCTDGLQTLVDLAAELDDAEWEQALECVLRRRLTTIEALEHAAMGRVPGAARMRRVLAGRPEGAPPTESRLETLMVQLARKVPGLPEPERQVVIRDRSGHFVARLDLAWPDIGLFIELDGQHHRNQPVGDARRETKVVALTGWLCGRFTFDDVVRRPSTTAARLAALAAQARRRPIPTAQAVPILQGSRSVEGTS